MEKFNKYFFRNFRTFPFSKRSFNEQHEYFVKADVYSVKEPRRLLTVVPIWQRNTYGNIIDLIRNNEVNGTPIPNDLYQPIPGEFVNVQWHLPLYRIWTDDDVRLGRCPSNKLGEYVQNRDGTYKVFNKVKVFCLINPGYIEVIENNITIIGEIDLRTQTPKYLSSWDPEYRARKKIEYCYEEIKKQS